MIKTTKTISTKKVAEVWGLGIVRCEEKRVDLDGNVCGQRKVWYDVCLANGEGNIIESFKTLPAAKKFAINW